MIGGVELHRRFSHHEVPEEQWLAMREVRRLLEDAASVLDVNLPDGREKATAITKLEEAMFWACAAIARPPSRKADPLAGQGGLSGQGGAMSPAAARVGPAAATPESAESAGSTDREPGT